jgi:hypothetical protein
MSRLHTIQPTQASYCDPNQLRHACIRMISNTVAQKRSREADEEKEAGRSRSREAYLSASALPLLNRGAVSALPSIGTLQSLLHSK